MRNINKVIAVGFSLAFTSFNCFSQKTSLKEKKSLKDFFLPMPINHKLADKGIWGNANVLPRDTTNGLEDSKLEKWCYWDGDIVKGSDNKYHLYASRWGQEFPHSTGWTKDSKGVHAVSDFITGPYIDKGVVWPDWNKGKGHNVGGLKMKDGRYAIVTSEITEGEIFVSDNPNGPFKFHGKIEVDNNGFKRDLARYNFNGHMSNVKIILRHDGRYMIVARSTAVMISDSGILGPYKIMSDRVYKKYPELPQTKNEDPTVWYSGGMYHIVYNHWPTKTSHHFSSKDGIHDWKYRGIAFEKGVDKIFKYKNGIYNNWEFIERPTAFVGESGHVTHFNFSVIDVHKGADLANDNHASKIIVVPFDGKAFDEYMKKIYEEEDSNSENNNVIDTGISKFEEQLYSFDDGIVKKGMVVTKGSPENWTQEHGFVTTNEKFYSAPNSMMLEINGTDGKAKLQTFKNSNGKNGKFNIKKGEYNVSFKLYIKGDSPKYITTTLKGKTDVNVNFNISNKNKNEWVEVSSKLNVLEDLENAWFIISSNQTSSTNNKGVIYIDDFRIDKKEKNLSVKKKE